MASALDPALYVTMLTTRRTRLDGANPPVGVFRSRDGGDTWEHLGWTQGKAFAVIPLGDTLVVAQGNGVHLSTDGGRSWRIVTDWRVTEVQDVTADPGAPGRLFAATPYGVFRSDDLGASWREASAGLDSPDATFVSTVRVDRAEPGRALIGTEAGLFVSDSAGASWHLVWTGEPGSTAGRPPGPSTGPPPSPTTGPQRVDDFRRAPVRSLRQSPHDPRRWAAALQGRGLALSDDGGRTWRGAPALEGTTLYEVEWDPFEGRTLWAAGWKTGVLRSRDGGSSWERLAQDLPETAVHGLGIPGPGVVVVGTMGEGLFRTVDGGRTWASLAPEVFGGGQVWDVVGLGEW